MTNSHRMTVFNDRLRWRSEIGCSHPIKTLFGESFSKRYPFCFRKFGISPYKTGGAVSSAEVSDKTENSVPRVLLGSPTSHSLFCFFFFCTQGLALCSNDAKICYDRIVLLVTALAMCHLGGTINGINSMVETLSTMKHQIQLVFGDSKKGQNYKDWEAAIARIRQGTGAGPQIWAAVSIMLFKVMREDGSFAKDVTDRVEVETIWICFCGWHWPMPNSRAGTCNCHYKPNTKHSGSLGQDIESIRRSTSAQKVFLVCNRF